MSSLLTNGISALNSFQRALSTISHNVANANTVGYSRQKVDFSARPGQAYGYGFVGAGVQVDGIRRVTDLFNFSRSLDSGAELGRLSELSALASRVDKAVSDTGTGLGKPWSAFFDAGQEVTAQPTSTAARQSLLSSASGLAARFRALDAQFRGMESELNGKVKAGVEEANQLSGEIARINQEIVRQRGLAGGQPPNDLLDQRERLVGELSARLGVSTVLQEDGAMNVFTPTGQAMVVGTAALKLSAVADPYSPDRLELAIETQSGQVRLGANAVGGSMGGLLEFRHAVLDPASAQLGRMAATLAHSFNAQHRAGIDLYGQPGGDFFTPIAPSVAAHGSNGGTASLDARLTDVAAFRGEDVVLSFDGTGWSAAERISGRAVALTGTGTAVDPLVFNGISVEVSGAAAANDRFLVRPAIGAASRLQVAISDPARVAAASPHKASVDLGNLGNATIKSIGVDDLAALNFGSTADIEFVTGDTTLAQATVPTSALAAPADTNGDGSQWDYAAASFDINGVTINVAAVSEATEADARAARLADVAAQIAAAGIPGVNASYDAVAGELSIDSTADIVVANVAPVGETGLADGTIFAAIIPGPLSYTINSGPRIAYNAATGIVHDGWKLTLDGTPQIGDIFHVAPRGPGSSDNGNARLFADLDNLGQLDGGNVSLNGALGQLTTSVGSAARHAEYERDAQQIIDTQVRAERDAVSGVNLDEEAANLMRFQQAYQAAAQMIGTADTLFQTLLAAVRR